MPGKEFPSYWLENVEKPIISAIAAIGQNRELGKNGKIPWHIPEDFAYFKKITSGHPVIMGRKTFESIGKPLSDRTNIIVTRNTDFKAAGCIVVDSIEKAIEEAGKHPAFSAGKDQEEIFVIGGGEIYKQAMPYIDKLYLTVVKGSFEADTFFPDYSEFDKVLKREDMDNGKHQFSFLEIIRQ